MMKLKKIIIDKIFLDKQDLKKLKNKIDILKSEHKKIVFTNGCFDILHLGHVDYLKKSKNLGDFLIIAINSDSSVKRLKGNSRPIFNENDRAFVLSSLRFVDAVCMFDEDTPFEIISYLLPDVLVKGGDYKIENIVGHDIVERNGGKTVIIPFLENHSTSFVIKNILSMKDIEN